MPGGMADGTTLLPNGWRIQPAGKHVKVGDMPLNLMQTPDSKYLVVTSNGLARPSFSVVDIASWTVKSTMPLDNAWYGLAWHPDGTRLYSAGAGQNNVQEFNYANGVITRARSFALPAVTGAELRRRPGGQPGRHDAVRHARLRANGVGDRPGERPGDEDGDAAGRAVHRRRLGRRPRLYVSLWGGAKVQVYMLPSMTLLAGARHRRASERDGALARRQAAVRRLRQQRLGLGLRHLLG